MLALSFSEEIKFPEITSLRRTGRKRVACMLSHFNRVGLFVTLWTVACQAPLSVGFSRQEYWSGLPCHPPGDLSDPGIQSTSLMSPALTGGFFTTSAAWKAQDKSWIVLIYLP